MKKFEPELLKIIDAMYKDMQRGVRPRPTHGDIQDAKEREIEYVLRNKIEFTPVGRRLVAACPFHEDENHSFNVFLDSNSYHCFECETGGDVIDLAMRLRKCSYQEAVRWLLKYEWLNN